MGLCEQCEHDEIASIVSVSDDLEKSITVWLHFGLASSAPFMLQDVNRERGSFRVSAAPAILEVYHITIYYA